MENSIRFSPELFTSERKKKTVWKRVLGVLACIVVFCTTYALILPAITATLSCGKEEHAHTDECYINKVKYYASVLNCTYDEHTHTDACYDENGKLVCGRTEHVHEGSCFGQGAPVYEKVLVCTKEEHTHNEFCYDSIFRQKMTLTAPARGALNSIEWTLTPKANGNYKLYVGGTGAIPSEFYTNEDIAAALAEIEANGALVDLVIGKDITSIGTEAFYALNMISSVEFEDYSACTTIGTGVFRACANCTTVTFPEHNSLISIGKHGFYRMQTLKNVNLEACTSLETIGEGGFAEYNDIVSVKLPASVKTLGTSCFASCALLEHCDLSDCDLLEGIPETCFNADPKLKEITIPSGCSYIKAKAFLNCYALESVCFEENHSDQFVFYERCFAMSGEAKNHTALKEFNMEALGTCGSVGMKRGGDTFSMFLYGGPENIIIPSNFIGEIDGSAKNSIYCLFHYATNVKHITFLENNNPLKLDSTFAAHTGIYELDLRPLKNVTTQVYLPYGGTSTLDAELNLETIYLPEKATSTTSGGSCPNLKYIIFPDGSAMTKIGGFNTDAGLEEIDLSDLEKLKTISAAFHDDANLSVIILPNNGLNILLDDSFYNDPSLVEVDLTDSSVYQLSRVFYNDENLKKIALPTTFYQPYGTVSDSTQPDGYIHKGILYNDPALEDVYIDSVRIMDTKDKNGRPNTYMYSEDSFTNCGPFILHFGPDVDQLPIEFLQDASRSCGAILFAGNNNILFTKNEETEHKGANLPSMLRYLEGEYFADASGVLYKLNDDGTATLVYVPPYVHGSADDAKWGETPLTSYTVPASIIDANGDTYNVTAVREDAFLLASNLEELNGKDGMEDASGALDALGFKGVDLNNTALDGAEHHADPITDPDYPTEGKPITDGPLSVKEEHQDTDEEGKPAFNPDGTPKMVGTNLSVTVNDRQLWTGEVTKDAGSPSNVVVNLYNTLSEESKVGRVYFAFSDPDYFLTAPDRIGIPLVGGTGDAAFDYQINRIGDSDVYYLDIGPVAAGGTGSLDFSPKYESPGTGGGSLKIWAELLEDPDEAPDPTVLEDEPVQVIEWKTKPDHYDPVKTAGTGNKLVKNGSVYYATGLNFELTLNRVGDSISLGKNYVKSIDFTDVLTLPEQIVWCDGVLEAITAGNWRLDRVMNQQSLYVTVGDKELLVATVNVKGMTELIPSVVDGKLKLEWSADNTASTEYSMGTGKIAYGNEVLRLALPTDGTLEANQTYVVTNEADAFIHYTYDDQTYDPAPVQAQVEFVTGDGNVTVEKTQSRKSGYWGEDQTFTITVKNDTLFPYNGVESVSDPLTNIYYIKPADLARMFGEDALRELSVTINGATLCETDYEPRQVTMIDGAATGMTSIVNSSEYGAAEYADEHYVGLSKTVEDVPSSNQNILKIRWSGSDVVIDVYPNPNATDPTKTVTVPAKADGTLDFAAALEGLHYMPTNTVTYEVRWTMEGESKTVPAQTTRVYKIYSTFKDTFGFLANDLEGCHDKPAYGSNISNTATLDLTNDPDKTSKISTSSFNRELELAKNIMHGGKEIGSGNRVEDEDALDNTVTIKHHGTSTYEVFPIVDRLTGAQVMMAKVSENPDADWADGLDTVSYNNEDYYLLTVPAGETNKVYHRVNIGGYYADTVDVTRTADGYSTLTKWYLQDAFGREMTMKIEYPSWVSTARTGITSSSYSANNRVWVGDHPTHRLFDTVGVGGTHVNFNKYIVLEKEEDVENESGESPELGKYSAIYKGDSVLYRLRLLVYGYGTILGEDLYDQLPQNFETFSWVKKNGDEGNVEIVGYVYDENIVTIVNGDSWSIGDKPTGQPKFVPVKGQQFLQWAVDDPATEENEGFRAIFKESGTLDIYVRLTFPNGDEWGPYAAALGGNQLENTMFFQELPDMVQHDVIAPVSAVLQKGVWDTGFLTNATSISTGSYPYVLRDNASIYTNSVNGSQARVTYYADLYNEGPGRLYLDTIQDILPEGFTFFSLTNAKSTYLPQHPYNQLTVGSKIGYNSALTERTKYTNSNSQVTGAYHAYAASGASYGADPLSTVTRADGKAVTYVVALLTVDDTLKTTDGRTILRITATGDEDGCTLSYDEKVGRWYLKPGECLRFGYDAKTNYYSNTKDVAQNHIAMPVPDPYEAGVTLDTDDTISTSNVKTVNNGTAEMISSTGAHERKFDGGDANTKWLASAVTVRRTPIQPGISKVDTKIIGKNGTERTSDGNVHYDDTVVWETTVTNSKESAMVNYTVTDTMDAPFRFNGPVYFEIYEDSGLKTGTYANGTYTPDGQVFSPILSSGINHLNGEKHYGVSTLYPLFTLRRDDANNCYLKLGSDEVKLENGVTKAVGGTNAGFRDVYYYNHSVNSDGKGSIYASKYGPSDALYEVTWSRDADGKETLAINFNTSRFGIPANGALWLQYRTEEYTTRHENKTYFNQTWVTPTQTFDPDGTDTGIYVTYNGQPSVWDDEQVNVVSGFTTSAQKSVREIGRPTNEASTETSVKWILLESADSLFTYTLKVNGTAGNVMDKLVLIDNLPEPNDHTTFALSVPRNSAFGVSFADAPNVTITVTYQNEAGETVTVTGEDAEEAFGAAFGFSTKTAFAEDDWDGGNASGSWTDSPSASSRSLRVILKGVPKGAVVTVSFDGKVTDKDKAEPGTIAWNNFGYSYVVDGTTLQASPSNVGIRVPSIPKLVKRLTLSGSAYPAHKDADFTFVVYRGSEVSGLAGKTKAEIEEALGDVEHHFITVPVSKGESASEAIRLEKNDLGESLVTFWENGETYTVTEVDPGEDYRFTSVNDTSSCTFVYRNDANFTVSAVNERRVWKLLLSKNDVRDTSIVLPDALFGLYSPDAEDLLPEDKREGYAGTATYEGKTYYLCSVKETDEHGLISWDGLLKDEYLVIELRAPKGYFLDDTPYLEKRADAVNEVLEMTVSDPTDYRLPDTGGIGIPFLYALSATAITGSAMMCGTLPRRRRERRKKK